jgi:chromosome segregation ATPase
LSKASQEIEQKSSELRTVKDELARWKLESSSFKEQLEVAKAKMSEETSKLEKSKSEAVQKLTSDVDALKATLGEKKAEAEALKIQISEKEKTHCESIETVKKELAAKEDLLSKANQDLAQEQSNGQRLGQELRTSSQQILELQESFDNLQRTYDEEMGEMVDVVNDLKEKEEEMRRLNERLDHSTSELEKSKSESLRLEEKHQEELRFFREKSEKEIATLTGKLEESQNQIRYLKDSLASTKIDLDLHLEKEERDRATFSDGHRAELEMKNMAIAKLKEELADKETLLDLTREELVSIIFRKIIDFICALTCIRHVQ